MMLHNPVDSEGSPPEFPQLFYWEVEVVYFDQHVRRLGIWILNVA